MITVMIAINIAGMPEIKTQKFLVLHSGRAPRAPTLVGLFMVPKRRLELPRGLHLTRP